MGYFNPIHNTVFEALKLIDVYSIHTLASLIFNNILFGNLNKIYMETRTYENEPTDFDENPYNPQGEGIFIFNKFL